MNEVHLPVRIWLKDQFTTYFGDLFNNQSEYQNTVTQLKSNIQLQISELDKVLSRAVELENRADTGSVIRSILEESAKHTQNLISLLQSQVDNVEGVLIEESITLIRDGHHTAKSILQNNTSRGSISPEDWDFLVFEFVPKVDGFQVTGLQLNDDYEGYRKKILEQMEAAEHFDTKRKNFLETAEAIEKLTEEFQKGISLTDIADIAGDALAAYGLIGAIGTLLFFKPVTTGAVALEVLAAFFAAVALLDGPDIPTSKTDLLLNLSLEIGDEGAERISFEQSLITELTLKHGVYPVQVVDDDIGFTEIRLNDSLYVFLDNKFQSEDFELNHEILQSNGIRSVNIVASEEKDNIVVEIPLSEDLAFAEVNAELKGGDDEIELHGFHFFVEGGEGRDEFIVRQAVDAQLYGGNGRDTFRLSYSTAGEIDGGDGFDTVDFTDSRQELRLNGLPKFENGFEAQLNADGTISISFAEGIQTGSYDLTSIERIFGTPNDDVLRFENDAALHAFDGLLFYASPPTFGSELEAANVMMPQVDRSIKDHDVIDFSGLNARVYSNRNVAQTAGFSPFSFAYFGFEEQIGTDLDDRVLAVSYEITNGIRKLDNPETLDKLVDDILDVDNLGNGNPEAFDDSVEVLNIFLNHDYTTINSLETISLNDGNDFFASDVGRVVETEQYITNPDEVEQGADPIYGEREVVVAPGLFQINGDGVSGGDNQKSDNDLIIAKNAAFIKAQEAIEDDPDTPEDESRQAQEERRLEVAGGRGSDWLLTLGGVGAEIVGGEGRDFIFNTSLGGKIWGDKKGGTDEEFYDAEKPLDNSDVFWYWPGTFIQDARPNDIVQLFGFPLTGGTNVPVRGGDAFSLLAFLSQFDNFSAAIDFVHPFIAYAFSDSGQLLIYNLLPGGKIDTKATLANGEEIEVDPRLARVQVVENYDRGQLTDSFYNLSEPGDLGLTFRIYGGAGQEVFFSIFSLVWGFLVTHSQAVDGLTKTLQWLPVDDPLVLDLDGDGIETTRLSQSGVHFDFDGDFFAENSAWLESDDGFLVLDSNNNNRIDDITEMFGAPGVSGFTELAAEDDNSDGVINADDAVFEALRVWRDLDQDGETDDGELFTLSDLGISSIAAEADPDGATGETPTGNQINARATFTREDGSTGNVLEVVFDTEATDTIFRGEKGTAEWLKGGFDGTGAAAIPDIGGRGAMANLAVHISSDFAVAETIETVAASLTTPKLKDLIDGATDMFGVWAQSLELTRELTPVLLDTSGAHATLVDRAVYVEDETGGFWTLHSGNDVLDGNGDPIGRATLEDVMAQATANGQTWQLEQMFSPQSRGADLAHREEAPYLARVVEGRVVVEDYGIRNEDGTWRLASGDDVTDADGNPIAAPTRDDILAMAAAEGTEWRSEALGFNPFVNNPVDRMGVRIVDEQVTDYTVEITDADGTFLVWARNLDRALQLQEKLGRAGDFQLRNFEVDLDTLDEVGSTDDSAIRVEVLTAGQFHFASTVYGIDFRPEIMAAQTDPDTGIITYNIGSFTGEDTQLTDDEGNYVSPIKPAIELFDVLMETYITVSRGYSVRLALQGGLSDYARGLEYVPDSDEFRPTTDRELAPMFEAIFETIPQDATEAYQYLQDWNLILNVVYADYHVAPGEDLFDAVTELNDAFVFQMMLPAFEAMSSDIDIFAAANALGVDETKVIDHQESDTLVEGTTGKDFFYISKGNQTVKGAQGADIYFLGADFGEVIIDDVEKALADSPASDQLRFTSVRSDEVIATRDGLDLVLEVINSTDVVRIKDQFKGDLLDPLFGRNFADDTGVVSIFFADGEIWNGLDIAVAVNKALDSDDLVLGSEVGDYLHGGKGNDILQGGRDADIYAFFEGDGVDTVQDANDRPTDDFVATKYDILQFSGDINPENIRYERIGESNDVTVYLQDDEGNDTGDQLTIKGQFTWFNVPFFGLLFPNQIERITFDNGSHLTPQDLMQRVIDDGKTDGADIIYGFNNDDVLDGGAGDDYLIGRAQNDTYIYGRDYGTDVIEDGHDDLFGASFDRLQFTDDLRWTDFDLIREGDSATVSLRVKGTNDSVILEDQYKSQSVFGFRDLVEELLFADGTVWDYFKLASQFIEQATTEGDDIIYGFEISDTIHGSAGDDRMEGGNSSDVYYYAEGDGNDVIFDSQGFSDRLVLEGIALNDVDISRNDNDLVFTLKTSGETITMENQYNRDARQGNAVDFFEFSDRVVRFHELNPEDVDLVGTSADETLTGSNFAEIIDGRGGDDTLIGNSDGDTYLFDIGYGNDTIIDKQEQSTWFGRDGVESETTDTVRFGAGITRDNIVFTKDGDDLVISITDHQDTLRIKNHFRSISEEIETFEFDGDGFMTARNVEELLSIEGGNRGDNIIEGAENAENVLDGRQGDDQLIGGRLGDTYVFDAAYDLDEITESSNPVGGSVDRVVFGSLVQLDTSKNRCFFYWKTKGSLMFVVFDPH